MSEQPVQVVSGKEPRRLAGPISATATAGLALALLLIILGATAYFVPRFKKIFDDFGTQLPGPTMVVVNISDFLVSYWFLVVPLIMLLFAGLIVWIWRVDWRSGLVAGMLLILALLMCFPGLVITLVMPLVKLIQSAKSGTGP